MIGLEEGTLPGGLAYIAFGEGPPLLSLPALTADHENPDGLDRWMQRWMLRGLAKHFTVYIVNRRRGLVPGTTMADLADDYAAAIRGRFGVPVPVLGTSTGGSVALQLAVDHPDVVDRLVVVASACRLSPEGREVQTRLAQSLARGRPRSGWAAFGASMTSARWSSGLLRTLMWLSGRAMTADDPTDLIRTLQAEDAFDVCSDLARIGTPTLLVAGARDRLYPAELVGEMAERIPDCRIVMISRAGHIGVAGSRRAALAVTGFLAQQESRALGSRPLVVWVIKHVVSPVDRWVVRVSGGRMLPPSSVVVPTLLLTTTGQRSGQARTIPLIYVRAGDAFVVANARPAGERENPWVGNLRAAGRARVRVRGRTFDTTATELGEEEIDACWDALVAVWPAFRDHYRATGERSVFVLTPDTGPGHFAT